MKSKAKRRSRGAPGASPRGLPTPLGCPRSSSLRPHSRSQWSGALAVRRPRARRGRRTDSLPWATTPWAADDARLLARSGRWVARAGGPAPASERTRSATRVGAVGGSPRAAPTARARRPASRRTGGAVAARRPRPEPRRPRERLDRARGAVAAPRSRTPSQVRAIRELTIKDDTASCFNRRYFEEFILEEHGARRTGSRRRCR